MTHVVEPQAAKASAFGQIVCRLCVQRSRLADVRTAGAEGVPTVAGALRFRLHSIKGGST